MPEIAEVARIVHYLRLHLVGKTIKKADAIDDSNVFGKVGTTGSAVAAALTGKKAISAGSQGKYFWLVLDSPPHLVMHFGMTGWIHIKNDRTAYTNYYKKMKAEEFDLWPPKFWKFRLETADDPAVELAFTDPRRFGRVRLIDCPGAAIRAHSPLAQNGPDPVVDADAFTEEFLRGKMRSRHVPVKALLLDQATISGIGNWVADEVLYQARLHPEQYCDDFGDEHVAALFRAICHVCRFAVDKLGDSDEFPDDWLFHHRWGKGTKGATSHLPSGEKLAFLTVGGRTSCYVPSLQMKTPGARIVPGVKEQPLESDEGEDEGEKKPKKPKKSAKAKAKVNSRVKAKPEPEPELEPEPKTEPAEDEGKQPAKNKRKAGSKEQPAKRQKGNAKTAHPARKSETTQQSPFFEVDIPAGRRRSLRLREKV